MLSAQNLSTLTNMATARTNLQVLGLTGGTLTGNLIINPPTSVAPAITLNSAVVGNSNSLNGEISGLMRWSLQLGNGLAESGSNVGSDFNIFRYNDAGTVIGTPLTINRATGNITAAQSLLVGTTYPQPPATIYQPTVIAPQMALASNGNLSFNAYVDNPSGTPGWKYLQNGYAADIYLNQGNGKLTLVAAASGSAGAAVSYTGSLTIDAVGNLASNGNTLSIVPGSGYCTIALIKPGSGTACDLYGQNGSYARWLLRLGNEAAETGGNNGSDFAIFRFNDAGAAVDSPFSIPRATGIPTLSQCKVTGAGVNYPSITNDYFAFTFANPWVYVNVDNGSVQYPLASASDERLKQDIAPTQYDCLAAVADMPLFEFRWKDHSEVGNPQPAKSGTPLVPAGFVAQRLYKVAPHCVHVGGGGALGAEHAARALAGEAGDTGKMWSIETNAMMATLVGAVQQLAAQVRTLQAEVAQLKQ
jgi:hypothetical protein